MRVKAGPGWASTYLPAIGPGDVALDPAQQFAVHQVLARYAFALDQHDLQALGGVLTEDATWAIRIADDSELGPVVGREAILQFVQAAIDAQTDQQRHHLVNVTLHSADTDKALVHAYLMLTSNAGGDSGVIATGFYTFGLERSQGHWRIAKLFLGTDNAW